MYKEQEIRCNAVAPGGIVTELPMTMPPMNEDGMKSFELMYPLSTGMGEPEDIANAVLFLASDESKFINGTYITVDAKLWPRKSSVSANSVLTGDIMMMPGLLKTLAAERIDVDEDGVITGLF